MFCFHIILLMLAISENWTPQKKTTTTTTATITKKKQTLVFLPIRSFTVNHFVYTPAPIPRNTRLLCYIVRSCET